MKININATDNDGIESGFIFDSDFEFEEDFRDFVVLIFKLLLKNGANVPEELVEELDKL